MKTSSLPNTAVTHQSLAILHLDARGMVAIVGTQEHRVQCGRSRILALNRLSPGSSAAARTAKGAFWVRLSGEDRWHMNILCDRVRECLGKD
jgi:hypothetical protein